MTWYSQDWICSRSGSQCSRSSWSCCPSLSTLVLMLDELFTPLCQLWIIAPSTCFSSAYMLLASPRCSEASTSYPRYCPCPHSPCCTCSTSSSCSLGLYSSLPCCSSSPFLYWLRALRWLLVTGTSTPASLTRCEAATCFFFNTCSDSLDTLRFIFWYYLALGLLVLSYPSLRSSSYSAGIAWW